MFKKLNFKSLLIIFGGLLVLVVILKVVQHNKGDRNFKAAFFEVDTARVSTIRILPHSTKEEFRLVRSGKTWNLVKKNKNYKAEKNAAESMLDELQHMKPEFVAAMDKSEWPQYQVTDSSATRVKVEQEGKTVADFFVGKASFKQYEQTSYIRLAGDDNVYAVNGLLAMTFNRESDDFRDKTLVRIGNASSVNRLEFNYPDSSFILTREKTGWSANGVKLDSAKVAGYVNNITYLSGSDFVDDSFVPGKQIFTITLSGENFKPVELKAFVADAANQYIVTSSMNAEGRFSGARGELAKRTFVGLSYFKPTLKKEGKGKK